MTAIDAAGEGPALALLHGLGADRTIWRPAARWLARGHRVLAADLPGFGSSEPIGPGFALAEVADALAAELADAAGGAFDLVGNSLGGAVALVLAHRHPERVRRLVLVAPAGFAVQPAVVAEVAARLAPTALSLRGRFGAPFIASARARRLLLYGAVANPERLPVSQARTMLLAARQSQRIGDALRTIMVTDLRGELAALEIPVGFLWGEHDRVVALEPLREELTDHPLEVIPDAGHAPQAEHPQAFAVALDRMLGRLDPG